MIKRLRIKFIIIAFSAVLLILGLIVTIMNVSNYSRVRDDADSKLQELYNAGGSYFQKNRWSVINEDTGLANGQEINNRMMKTLINYQGNDSMDQRPGDDFPDPFADKDKDDIAKTIFVTFIKVKSNDTLYRQSSSQSLTEDSMYSMYEATLSTGYSNGYVDKYWRYYHISNEQGDDFVLMVDNSTQIFNSRNFLKSSLLISATGLLAFLMIIVVGSYIIFKPVEEAYLKQKRFISNAAHELKTPLTIISANNEVEEMLLGENEQTHAITKQVSKLTGMVNSLTKLALLEENYKLEKTEKFQIDEAVLDVVDSYSQKFKERKLDIITDVKPNIIYDGDEGLFRVLVSILLDNAFKYSIKYIKVNVSKDVDKIIISISNDSDDLADGLHPELFERFYRTENKRASNIQGSGIGLSIAYEIVMVHKGKITAEASNNVYTIKVVL